MNIKIKYFAIIVAFLNGQVFSSVFDKIGDFVVKGIVKSAIVYQCSQIVSDPCSTEENIDGAALVMNAVVPIVTPVTNAIAASTKDVKRQLEPLMPVLEIFANQRATTPNHVADIYRGITYDPATSTLSIVCKRPVFRFRSGTHEITETTGFQRCPHQPINEVYARYGSLVYLFAQTNEINLVNIRKLNIDLSSLYPLDNIPDHIEGILPISPAELTLTSNYLVFSRSAEIANQYLDSNYDQLTYINQNLQQLTLRTNGEDVFSHSYVTCTQIFFDYCAQTRIVKWFKSLCGTKEHQD